MKIIKISEDEKKLIICLSILFLLYFYLTYFLFPTIDDIKNARLIINKYDNAKSAGAAGAVRGVDYYYSKVKNEKGISDISIAIPEMVGNPEIVYNIKLIADKSGVELNKLTFGDVVENHNFEDKIYIIPLNIILWGSHSNIVSFLKLIENDKRICEINNVNINNINEYMAETVVNISYFCTGGE